MNPIDKIEDIQHEEVIATTTVPTNIITKPTNPIKNASSLSIITLDQSGKPDLTKYTPAELAKYKQLGTVLQTNDSNSILNYGIELQNKLAGYSDQFLGSVRSFDAGEIGGSINNLLAEVNYIDIDPSQQSALKRFAMAIPGLRNLVMNTKKIFQKYDTVSANIDGIVKKLDQGRLVIIKDNNQLQNLFVQNIDYIKQLEELIIVGHIRREELDLEIKNMEMTTEQYQDYEISDKKEFLNRLDKRLNDMAITRIITIQSLPQIRLVQNNNSTMVEKIQSSVTTTIPIWKNQISVAVALMRQKNIADLNDKIYQTTNTILKKNSEMLKQNTVDIARQNERGVVSIDTLREVQQNLISTLNDIKKIKEEGEATRRTVAKDLETLEKDLKNNVLGLSNGTTNIGGK